MKTLTKFHYNIRFSEEKGKLVETTGKPQGGPRRKKKNKKATATLKIKEKKKNVQKGVCERNSKKKHLGTRNINSPPGPEALHLTAKESAKGGEEKINCFASMMPEGGNSTEPRGVLSNVDIQNA